MSISKARQLKNFTHHCTLLLPKFTITYGYAKLQGDLTLVRSLTCSLTLHNNYFILCLCSAIPTHSHYRCLTCYFRENRLKFFNFPLKNIVTKHICLPFLLLQKKNCPCLYLSLISLPMFRIPIFINFKIFAFQHLPFSLISH